MKPVIDIIIVVLFLQSFQLWKPPILTNIEFNLKKAKQRHEARSPGTHEGPECLSISTNKFKLITSTNIPCRSLQNNADSGKRPLKRLGKMNEASMLEC